MLHLHQLCFFARGLQILSILQLRVLGFIRRKKHSKIRITKKLHQRISIGAVQYVVMSQLH